MVIFIYLIIYSASPINYTNMKTTNQNSHTHRGKKKKPVWQGHHKLQLSPITEGPLFNIRVIYWRSGSDRVPASRRLRKASQAGYSKVLSHAFSARFIFTPRAFINHCFKKIQKNLKHRENITQFGEREHFYFLGRLQKNEHFNKHCEHC